MSERTIGESCLVRSFSTHVIIGDDLHMNGLDAPARVYREDVQALIDYLIAWRDQQTGARDE